MHCVYVFIASPMEVSGATTLPKAAAGDPDLARDLCLWDRDLSIAFLADLAILEVALGNAMSARLEPKWGMEWYTNLDRPQRRCVSTVRLG